MKQFKSIMLLLAMSILTSAVYGQSKKTIMQKGIKTQTVHEYFIAEGMKRPVVESIEKYNSLGEVTEIKEYNKSGEVRLWEKYVYDSDGNLTEEIFLDERGRVTTTEKNIYEDGLRVEKQYYDEKGRLFKKKVYEYEYSQ